MKNFKIIKAIFLPFALLIIQAVYAQAPLKMSYQAVIRTASNELIRSSIIRTRISILPNSPTETPVYSELQTQRTDYNGLLSLKIGEGEILLGEIDKINWGASSFYIKTETDPSGGNDFSLVSSVELMSVPYALYALKSGSYSGDQDLTLYATKVNLDTKVDKVNGERLMNAAEITKLANQSGINTGDQDLTTYATNVNLDTKVDKVNGDRLINATEITKLANQSGTNTGDQDLTLYATNVSLNTKVDKVNGERLINATEITKLANQSGTNTGDQDLTPYATNISLNTKVDKVLGKSLLDDSEITRISAFSNYIHPVNHPASIITQDVNNLFVTEAEKAIWNANSGGLKTSDGLKISYELKKIGDNLGGISPLKISRSDVTNNGQGDFENNTFFGKSAGISNYSSEIGKNNSFFGFNTGIVTIGSRNSFFGSSAGMFTTTGFQNVFVGQNAGMHNTTGGNNVFIGHYAGLQHTEGHYNVLVGAGAGSNITRGWSSVIVGNESQNLNPTDWNSIVIGARVTGNGQNTVTLGNDEIIKTFLKGTLSAKGLKVFDNNDAAKGALLEGDIYRTPTGDLKIVY